MIPDSSPKCECQNSDVGLGKKTRCIKGPLGSEILRGWAGRSRVILSVLAGIKVREWQSSLVTVSRVNVAGPLCPVGWSNASPDVAVEVFCRHD